MNQTQKHRYRLCLWLLLAAACSAFFYLSAKLPDHAQTPGYPVSAGGDTWVYPSGIPVGLYLQTEGVMVISTGDVTSASGQSSAPAKGKIQPGDYITAINDTPIHSKSQLLYYVQTYGNQPVRLSISRNGEETQVKLSPVLCNDGSYRLGLWVRDDAQGIGTMTYITKDGTFGALGHGISDYDTGKLLNSEEGKLYQAFIWGIRKGERGTPGGLCGIINYEEHNVIGLIAKNTPVGLYGTIDKSVLKQYRLSPVPVAQGNEIVCGPATLRCYLEQEPKDYTIEIVKYEPNKSNGKDFVLKVTDPELLGLTGGIIQGMSGSPILQNGKIIGAVTHVFVDDPAKGYGISIQTMLEQ